jgi:hypothetical protein
MERLTKFSRSLVSTVSALAPNALQLSAFGFGVTAAYDVSRPLGHVVAGISLGLIGRVLDGGKR